jgi:hypothetical protein
MSEHYYQLRWSQCFQAPTKQEPKKPEVKPQQTFSELQKRLIKELSTLNKPALAKLCKSYGVTLPTINDMPRSKTYMFIGQVKKAISYYHHLYK